MIAKETALHSFWSSFGWSAFEENSVPTGDYAPKTDYITYEVITGSFGDKIALTASLWKRSGRWLEINAKAEEISKFIGRGGVVLPCEDGGMWVVRGTPFSSSLTDEKDEFLKRKIINITVEFITTD